MMLSTLAAGIAGATRTNPRDGASWWIATYGLVDENQVPEAARAREVFERLADAADKKSIGHTSLLMINTGGKPLAMALPDNTVILTEEALRICYKGVSSEKGNARLAFVIGHELAHLDHDHFWHAQAFASLSSYGGEDETAAAIIRSLLPDAGDLRAIELAADAAGMLLMTRSGYDPTAVVEDDGAFLALWASQLDNLTTSSDTHPTPQERVTMLRSEMRKVAENLDSFLIGVRLLQLHTFDDAITLLEHFAEPFKCREVYNNLGLAHYELAVRSLAACDASLLLRQRLPTILDGVTLASRLRSSSDVSPCLSAESFQQPIIKAISYLELACAEDKSYLPARLNLASARLLGGDYYRAFITARDGCMQFPESIELAVVKALARYFLDLGEGRDAGEQGIEMIEVQYGRYPDSALIVTNLALMQQQRGRRARADELWQALLRLEPEGPWAEVAREHLGLPPQAAGVPEKPAAATRIKPPLPLGKIGQAVRSVLDTMHRHQIVVGSFRCTIYRNADLSILEIGSSLEMIEERINNGPDRQTLEATWGKPVREVTTTRGAFLVYDRAAIDMVDGRASATVFFSK